MVDSPTSPASGLLGRLPPPAVEALASYAFEVSFGSEQVLIHQGQEQLELFFLIEGQTEVLAETEGRSVLLAAIEPGDCFGEVSIFEPGPASATVRSISSGKMWKLDSDRLQLFLESYPVEACQLLLEICKVLSQRMRQAIILIKQNKMMPSFVSVRSRLRQQAALGSI